VRIESLELRDFRNYDVLLVEPGRALTVLVGPNAVGKTNVIEALQLVTSTLSFRRPRCEDLVRWDAAEARVSMRARRGNRRLETTLDITGDGKRTYTVNGQMKRKLSDVAGLLPSVVFTPDDLDMVKGPSERRRSSIDDLGEQISATYGSLRRDYARVVKQRNALLKDGGPGADSVVWDEQLVALGSRLLSHRERLLARVMASASGAYAGMADGEVLTWRYADRCGLPQDREPGALTQEQAATAMRWAMEQRRGEERRRLVTLVGPHRDDIVFYVGGREARAYASQGQQRTVALAWKLAEVQVVHDVLRRRPVLLLDDVMSELDADRRAALSSLVTADTQTFVTTTNLGYFSPELLEGATIVELGRAEPGRAETERSEPSGRTAEPAR
jgi:DNA replication and repair protein RecF